MTAEQLSPAELERSNESNFVDDALALATKGFFVFPLRPGAIFTGPGTPGPSEATRDPGQIIEWWTETPDANIGIATDATADVLVIEVNYSIGEESLRALEARRGPLPETLQASWGDQSRQLYFRYPAELESIKGSLGKNLGSSTYRGYIVAPPSIVHKKTVHSGVLSTRCEWINDQPLADLPEWAILRLAFGRASRVNPKILARRPLNPETLSEILDHFNGNKQLAYQTLAPNRPIAYLENRGEFSCGQNEFYKAMRGEDINGDFADLIEYLWLCTDKGDWRSDSLREIPDDPKEWIKRHIGSISLLHEKLFSNWSYPTVRNLVAGIGTEQNKQEFRARLTLFRQRKRHELRAQAARDKKAAPESYRRGGLAKRQQVAMEWRKRKQEKMLEQG